MRNEKDFEVLFNKLKNRLFYFTLLVCIILAISIIIKY